MKNNKKIISIIIIVFVVGVLGYLVLSSFNNSSLYSKLNCKNLKVNDIKSINVETVTIAGSKKSVITDKKEIKKIYNKYKHIVLTDKVNGVCCYDAGVGYELVLKSGKKIKIKQECSCMIVEGQRYHYIFGN